MRPCVNNYIALESISLRELVDQPPGSYGLYVPQDDNILTDAQRITRIARHATSHFSHHGKRCTVDIVIMVGGIEDKNKSSASKMVRVTVL